MLRVRENVNESIIVLLDNSASMTAVEADGKTRLELAKTEILDLAEHLSRDDEIMLITFNSRARVNCGFTDNKRKLKESISAVGPTECSTVAEPALALAKSIANSRAHPRGLLCSDGVIDHIPLRVAIRKAEIDSVRVSGIYDVQ